MSTDLMNIPTGTASSDEISEQRTASENELRDLVFQALEREGIVSRLKAQLRAAVFKTIERATNPKSTSTLLSSNDDMKGRICRALILDWLEHSQLLYTKDIFKVETTGSNYPVALTNAELLEQLHITPNQAQSQSILQVLVENSTNLTVGAINTLPDHIKQSIDNQFPNEKINDLNRIREHFRSLFSSAFDSTVLDSFINRNLPSSSTSFAKHDYEQICLKWMQACAHALIPSQNPTDQSSSILPSVLTSKNTTKDDPKPTAAHRLISRGSLSDTPSTSSEDDSPRPDSNIRLPKTTGSNPTSNNKASTTIPGILKDGGDSDNDDDDDDGEHDDEDESASIFSQRNATPAALEKLKHIDYIIQGNETPRSRTTVNRPTGDASKNFPIEYDEESVSQSVSHSIGNSVDDITVDKVSPSPSVNLDYLEDY